MLLVQQHEAQGYGTVSAAHLEKRAAPVWRHSLEATAPKLTQYLYFCTSKQALLY